MVAISVTSNSYIKPNAYVVLSFFRNHPMNASVHLPLTTVWVWHRSYLRSHHTRGQWCAETQGSCRKSWCLYTIAPHSRRRLRSQPVGLGQLCFFILFFVRVFFLITLWIFYLGYYLPKEGRINAPPTLRSIEEVRHATCVLFLLLWQNILQSESKGRRRIYTGPWFPGRHSRGLSDWEPVEDTLDLSVDQIAES